MDHWSPMTQFTGRSVKSKNGSIECGACKKSNVAVVITVLTVNPLVGLGYLLQGHTFVDRFGVGQADFVVEIRHGRFFCADR